MGNNNSKIVNRRNKEFKNHWTPNLEEIKVVNQGDDDKVNETRVGVYLKKIINPLKGYIDMFS